MKQFKLLEWQQIQNVQIDKRLFGSSRAEQIKRTNSEVKKLFGPVIKKEQKPDNNEDCDPIAKPIELNDSNQSSEIYWTINRRTDSKFVKIIKRTNIATDKNPDETNPTATIPPTTDNKEKSAKAVVSAKELLKNFIGLGRQKLPNAIPFDDNGLKSILKYPLVSSKADEHKLNEMICNTSIKLPSISKVLTSTMSEGSRIALKKWKLAKIAELGADGFRQYEQETLKIGSHFHSSIQNYFENQEVPDDSSSVFKLWQSVGDVLVKLDPKPVLIEKPILHPDLMYKGVIDCVSIVNDTICALEWKTSEQRKPKLTSTYDAPIQLCAYLGALNVDSRYPFQANNGYVVIAYKDGVPANSFHLKEADIKKYWSAWLARLQEFWIRTRDGTLPDPI